MMRPGLMFHLWRMIKGVALFVATSPTHHFTQTDPECAVIVRVFGGEFVFLAHRTFVQGEVLQVDVRMEKVFVPTIWARVHLAFFHFDAPFLLEV